MDNFGPKCQRFFGDHPEWSPVTPSACPLGWDEILAQALHRLRELAVARRALLSITQIKQKWAELRIYIRVEGEPTEFRLDLHSASGAVSLRTKNAEPGSVTDEAMDIIDRATELSRRTCEICGEAGQARAGHWYRVLCDRHTAGPS